MKQKIKNDTLYDGTFGRLELVEDFLPRPEDLVFKKPTKKVTITVDTDSLRFFKEEAKRLRTPYQRMIRNLLAQYVSLMRKK